MPEHGLVGHEVFLRYHVYAVVLRCNYDVALAVGHHVHRSVVAQASLVFSIACKPSEAACLYVAAVDGHCQQTSCCGADDVPFIGHQQAPYFLPALPSQWLNGEVTGLRSRGGFEIAEMRWEMGKVKKVSVKSTIGGNLRIRSNTQLKLADGTALTPATGNNTNPLMQAYEMPEPLVVNPSKIPDTNLPTTYLYDIPTKAGDVIILIDKDETSGISSAVMPEENTSANGAIYSTDGKHITAAHRGIQISKGVKLMRK